jgi:gag-polypeptide of LTR copia-type
MTSGDDSVAGRSNTSSSTQSSFSASTTNAGEQTIRIIAFTGKKDDWECWKDKFHARAIIKGYEGLLTGEEAAPKTHLPTGVKRSLITAEEKVLIDENQKGFVDLILSMDTTTEAGKMALKLVMGTKTDKELPGGSLRVAYLRLKNKYEPSTEPQLVLLNKKFHSTVMKANQDPDIFITELEAMKTKLNDLGHKMDDKGLILHILNNLSPDYSTEVRFLEQRMQTLKEVNKELTIEDVRDQLTIQYIRLKQNRNDKPVVEHALYMGARFKGKCHFCGKIGHKATECRQKLQSGNGNHNNVTNGNGNGNGNRFNNNINRLPKQTNEGNNGNRRATTCNYCHKKGSSRI